MFFVLCLSLKERIFCCSLATTFFRSNALAFSNSSHFWYSDITTATFTEPIKLMILIHFQFLRQSKNHLEIFHEGETSIKIIRREFDVKDVL